MFDTGKSQERTVQTENKPGCRETWQPESSDSDDEYIYSTGNDIHKSKIPQVTVQVNGVDVSMIVDTGASTDIIDEGTFNRITQRLPVQLDPRCEVGLGCGRVEF